MAIFLKTQTKFPILTTKFIKLTVEKANRSPIWAYLGHSGKRGKKRFLPGGPGAPIGSALHNPVR